MEYLRFNKGQGICLAAFTIGKQIKLLQAIAQLAGLPIIEKIPRARPSGK